MQIADREKQKRLLALLKKQEHFNWDRYPLTSFSMQDPAFVTTKGAYQGNASWSGNVWTLINEMVVRGLRDCHENELAAELALKTIRGFNHNCTEFLNPFDGSGHGVLQYAWTASQYLELLIEVIFGVAYDAEKQTVTVSPILTDGLKNDPIYLKGLNLTNDFLIDITLDHGKIFCSASNADLRIETIRIS